MRIVKENFLSPPILELDKKFVTAVNTLESQLVELKQLRLKGEAEAPVDWLEFVTVFVVVCSPDSLKLGFSCTRRL
ncbi:MAG: hypothetical protein GY696_24310 [Gammaproteobacteria bacterium]|nr:hypothetical protein [Gammaproteobacteria bacterium]